MYLCVVGLSSVGDVLVTPKPALQGEEREEAVGACVEQRKEGRDFPSESQTSLEEACAPGQPISDTQHPEQVDDETTDRTFGEPKMRLSSAEVYGSFKYDVLSEATTALRELHWTSRLQAGGSLKDGLKECGTAVSGSHPSTAVKPRSVIIGGMSSNSVWPGDQLWGHLQGATSTHAINTASHKRLREQQQQLVQEDSMHTHGIVYIRTYVRMYVHALYCMSFAACDLIASSTYQC